MKIRDKEKLTNSDINWNSLPSGILGWILWSLSQRIWRYLLWLIALFAAVTAILAFYQLWFIRGSQIDKYRIEILDEQWKRSDKPEWKRALINNWSEPSNFSNKIWKEATEHLDPTVRIAAARNPWLPELYLEKLTKDPKLPVRMSAILAFSNTLIVIDLLSKDINPQVRRAVAENESTPKDVLIKLAEDNAPVQSEVAENLMTPLNTLKILAGNKEVDVHFNALTTYLAKANYN